VTAARVGKPAIDARSGGITPSANRPALKRV
jgi:hypothetical protein